MPHAARVDVHPSLRRLSIRLLELGVKLRIHATHRALDAGRELVDENVLAVVPSTGTAEDVFFRARRERSAHAARTTIPVFFVRHRPDAAGLIVPRTFAVGETTIVE